MGSSGRRADAWARGLLTVDNAGWLGHHWYMQAGTVPLDVLVALATI